MDFQEGSTRMDTDLYSQVCSFENLYLAYRKARTGKRGPCCRHCCR
jgi:hypothetical protein